MADGAVILDEDEADIVGGGGDGVGAIGIGGWHEEFGLQSCAAGEVFFFDDLVGDFAVEGATDGDAEAGDLEEVPDEKELFDGEGIDFGGFDGGFGHFDEVVEEIAAELGEGIAIEFPVEGTLVPFVVDIDTFGDTEAIEGDFAGALES